MGRLQSLFSRSSKEPNVKSPNHQPLEPKSASELDPSVKPIPESERQFYEDDSYYQPVAFKGGPFEKTVTTFEEWKRQSYPSANGLYVPEILMLAFCGKYPEPKSGYPGYWWYKYGIRNVGAVYETLVERGFLELNEKGKYSLTTKGKAELDANDYVPFLHGYTTFPEINVWTMNKVIHDGDTRPFRIILREWERRLADEHLVSDLQQAEMLRAKDPKKAEEKIRYSRLFWLFTNHDLDYRDNQDTESYIRFWEDVWGREDMSPFGYYWIFRLSDLYIKAGRLSDALLFIRKVKEVLPEMAEDADRNEEKVIKAIEKEDRKSRKQKKR